MIPRGTLVLPIVAHDKDLVLGRFIFGALTNLLDNVFVVGKKVFTKNGVKHFIIDAEDETGEPRNDHVYGIL